MTLRAAAKIIECEITQESGLCVSAVVKDDGYEDVAMRFSGQNVKQAVKKLVDAVYKLRSQRVFERDGWKCTKCHLMKPLQIHHDPYRSHGGKHIMAHMFSRCVDCHDAVHSGREQRMKYFY